MEDVKEKKQQLRRQVEKKLAALGSGEIQKKLAAIEEQLFELANFIEAEISMLYLSEPHEVDSSRIIDRSLKNNKDIVLPLFDAKNGSARLFKIQDLQADLRKSPGSSLEPNPQKCKPVQMEQVDIAIIPGIAFDEKAGRLGTGTGRYDRIIPKLPATTRKVAIAFEDQIAPLVPLESHDKCVDIIITDERIIYKI